MDGFAVHDIIKLLAMQVDPIRALALDIKTSNVIISVGTKPHIL